MIMTILEARVSREKWEVLRKAYTKELQALPPAIDRTYLMQSAADSEVWRILTVWHSKEELDKMRSQGTPAGVLMFRAAGAEPGLSIFNIEASAP